MALTGAGMKMVVQLASGGFARHLEPAERRAPAGLRVGVHVLREDARRSGSISQPRRSSGIFGSLVPSWP